MQACSLADVSRCLLALSVINNYQLCSTLSRIFANEQKGICASRLANRGPFCTWVRHLELLTCFRSSNVLRLSLGSLSRRLSLQQLQQWLSTHCPTRDLPLTIPAVLFGKTSLWIDTAKHADRWSSFLALDLLGTEDRKADRTLLGCAVCPTLAVIGSCRCIVCFATCIQSLDQLLFCLFGDASAVLFSPDVRVVVKRINLDWVSKPWRWARIWWVLPVRCVR
jgi:hypothetical protein